MHKSQKKHSEIDMYGKNLSTTFPIFPERLIKHRQQSDLFGVLYLTYYLYNDIICTVKNFNRRRFMKKIIFGIVAVIMILGMLVSCNFTSDIGSEDNSISVLPDDSTELEDLYANIDEAHITEYSAKEIHSTYSVMCDKLNESKMPAKNSYNSFSKGITLLAAEDEEENPFNPADFISDIPSDIVEYFYILKDYAEKGFEKFCNNYAVIGKDTLVRIRINNTLQELELSVRVGNTYIFYSNYYINEKAQKHIEYEEGDYLFVEYHMFTYTAADNKVSFPINYKRDGHGYILNNADDFELLDITEAYDTLKYPFIRHIDSKLIQSLLDSRSATILGERQFRQAIDKTLYNANYVYTGEFDLEGINFFGGEIQGKVTDNKLVLNSDKYYVKTPATNIFYIQNGGLYIAYGFSSVHREATEDGIKQISDYTLNHYKIDEGVHKTDDGVYFDLKTEIDLSKPDYTYSQHDENIYGTPDAEFIPDEEEYHNVDSEGNYSYNPCYAFNTKQRGFMIFIDSFWN